MDESFIDLLQPFLKFLGDRQLTPESRLRELGLDSLQAVELLLTIEDVYHVTLPDEKLIDSTFETAGNLWTVISEVRAAEEAAIS